MMVASSAEPQLPPAIWEILLRDKNTLFDTIETQAVGPLLGPTKEKSLMTVRVLAV